MSLSQPPTIVHVVSTLEGGGTERTLLKLLGLFDPDRFQHVVVTLRSAGALTALLPDRVACIPLDCSHRTRRVFGRLAGVLSRYRAAVIHARNTGCWADSVAAATLCRKCQPVLGFHGLDSTRSFDWKQRLIAFAALRLSARFTSVSHSGALALHTSLGLPQDCIDVLPNGVETSDERMAAPGARTDIRRELGCADGEFVVAMVGSFVPVKQHALLIDAITTLARTGRRLRLVLIGDGPLRGALERKVSKSGMRDRVGFAGWRDDVAECLSGVDLYVCASASEGMSNALLEAMAAGLPSVATDVGDNRYLLLDGDAGLIVSPNNQREMTSALLRLMNDRPLRRRLGRRAAERARDFDLLETASRYEDYYQRMVERRGVLASETPPKGTQRPLGGKPGVGAITSPRNGPLRVDAPQTAAAVRAGSGAAPLGPSLSVPPQRPHVR